MLGVFAIPISFPNVILCLFVFIFSFCLSFAFQLVLNNDWALFYCRSLKWLLIVRNIFQARGKVFFFSFCLNELNDIAILSD